MSGSSPSYFIGFDDKLGWETFRNGAQTTFGVTESARNRASELSPGDQIVCYMIGLSCFCRVLEVLAEAGVTDGTSDEQRTKYPVRIPIGGL